MRGRLVLEQECQHGRSEPHEWPVWPSGASAGPPEEMWIVSCPGGKRREVTGRVVDNREMAWPGEEGLGSGRYLVIDLDTLEEGFEDADAEA